MQKSIWVVLFFVALVTNLAANHFKLEMLVLISKPLLVTSLIAWLIKSTISKAGIIFKLTITALFFSLIGDILLLFEQWNPLFFIGGLFCFLIAHIAYILVFNNIRKENKVNIRWWVLPIVLCYYSGLLYLLFPQLGELKIPVLIYGAVISTMLLVAVQLVFIPEKMYLNIAGGSILFIISDSILAFNKFYASFNIAVIMIMLTYALAQFFISKGILLKIATEKNNKILLRIN